MQLSPFGIDRIKASSLVQYAASAVHEPLQEDATHYYGSPFGDETSIVAYGLGPNTVGDADVLVKLKLDQGDYRRLHSDPPFNLNGLFKQMIGNVDIPGERLVAEVQVHPSPAHINEVQGWLGRKPGYDALKLVRPAGMGEYTPGEGVASFANKEVIVADYDASDPGLVLHDTSPADHVQSWLSLSPIHVTQISAHANRLAEKYGERIYNVGEEPKPVTNFTYGIDSLGDFTRARFAAVAQIGKQDSLTLDQLRHSYLFGELDGVDINILTWAGLLSVRRTTGAKAEKQRAATTFNMSLFAHLADTFLTLEEIEPSQDLGERKRRVRALEALKRVAAD
jgi:hypothetical protein